MSALTRNEKVHHDYLKAILEEVRSLKDQIRKLENEVKILNKKLTSSDN